MSLPPDQQKLLLPLKEIIRENFTSENWLELGAVTGCLDVVKNHHRLLRSLSWDDEDYPANVMDVLVTMVTRDPQNIEEVRKYLEGRFDPAADGVSSVEVGRRIYFTPSVFQTPEGGVDPALVAVMMPFDATSRTIFNAIAAAAGKQNLQCQRVDDMWEHSTVIQDIFSLIYRSFIVVCDFTGRNPNVFYECGIAHTLGKHVVPIAQHESDVPFDLRHHRYLHYLNNEEGLTVLSAKLAERFATLRRQGVPAFPFNS